MRVVIYSREKCPWCDRAKTLFSQYNIPYRELMLNVDYTKQELLDLLGRDSATVPQIFINDRLVGGYDDLCNYMEEHMIFGIQN